MNDSLKKMDNHNIYQHFTEDYRNNFCFLGNFPTIEDIIQLEMKEERNTIATNNMSSNNAINSNQWQCDSNRKKNEDICFDDFIGMIEEQNSTVNTCDVRNAEDISQIENVSQEMVIWCDDIIEIDEEELNFTITNVRNNSDISIIDNVSQEVVICCDDIEIVQEQDFTTGLYDLSNTEDRSHRENVAQEVVVSMCDSVKQIRKRRIKMRKNRKRKYFCQRKKPKYMELRKFKVASNSIPCMYELCIDTSGQEFHSREEKAKAHNLLALHFFELESPMKIIDDRFLDLAYNKQIVNTLKKRIPKSNDFKDRFITLMFDQMPVLAHLQYIFIKGILWDFEDNAENIFGKEDQIETDHSQIFMVRSVFGKWSYPVSYMFTKRAIKITSIVMYIKEIVKRLTNMGFVVAAIVSAPSKENCEAIDMLLNDSKQIYKEENKAPQPYIIRIGKSEMVPIFDIQHIIKDLRNHLLNNNVTYNWRGKTLTAQWEDIKTAYYNSALEDCDITIKHVYPKKNSINQIHRAIEVLSKEVGAKMDLASFSCSDGKILDMQLRGTAQLCSFIGTLFESLNIGVLPSGSEHVATQFNNLDNFWQEAADVVDSMRFEFRYDVEEAVKRPRVLRNLETTLISVFTLHTNMLKCRGINYLPTESFTQKPMDETFCKFRHKQNRRTI